MRIIFSKCTRATFWVMNKTEKSSKIFFQHRDMNKKQKNIETLMFQEIIGINFQNNILTTEKNNLKNTSSNRILNFPATPLSTIQSTSISQHTPSAVVKHHLKRSHQHSSLYETTCTTPRWRRSATIQIEHSCRCLNGNVYLQPQRFMYFAGINLGAY